MASPTYVPVEVVLGQLDEITNFIQMELDRGYVSNKMGELIKEQLQIVKKSEVQSDIDRNILKGFLACAKRQASERRGDASQNACNCTLCKDALSILEDDTPILTPTSSNSSASTVDSQTDQTLNANSKGKAQLLSSNASESQPAGKSTLLQDRNDLKARIFAGTDASSPKTADANATNSNGSEVNTKTAATGIRSKVSAAMEQAAVDMFGADVKKRLTKTASIYLALELVLTMPADMSTSVRFGCLLFTFAIITSNRARELVRLKESMLPGAEEVHTRQEIAKLNAWILVAVAVGLIDLTLSGGTQVEG